MKITVDPLPSLKLAKQDRVNVHYNNLAAVYAHRDQVYTQKRAWAQTKDPQLQAEANLRGITIDALAQIILSKPNTMMAREQTRQELMAKIDQAQTITELDAI